MSTLDQMKNGISRAWDSLAEGWQHMRNQMGNALTRYNPIHRSDNVDTVAERFEQRSSRWGLLASEVSESEKDIVVRVEAPGLEGSDFDIDVIDNYLVVRGEKRSEHVEQRGQYHVMECAYGRFERAVALPSSVEADQSKAKYKNGVLTVVLPKSHKPNAKRIEVKQA